MARKRTALWTLTGIATFAAIVVALWRTSDLGRAAGDLERQRLAAKREGLPTEYADLHRITPPLPPEENAAPLYEAAFADLRAAGGLKGVKVGTLLDAIAAGKAKPTDLATLRADLATAAPALAKAKEAAERKGFSYDRAWEKGAALLFPEYSRAQEFVRLLVLRAMLAPDPTSAAADLRTAARIRRDFGSEPVLISALVGNSIEATVHRGIRFVGRRGGAWTRAVAPVLDALGPIPALRRSLSSEAVWGMHVGDEVATYGAGTFMSMDGAPTPLPMRLMGLRPVRDASTSRIVEYWRHAWAGLPQDPTDFRATRAALAVPSPERGPSYAVLNFLLPVFENFGETNARSEADRRLTREALALWSGATPAPERDPFGTGPLRLRRNGRAWTLYSVGPDGKDDGGKPRRGTEAKGYDLVVEG